MRQWLSIRSMVAIGLIVCGGESVGQTPTSWTRGADTAGLWTNAGQWNLSAGPVPDASTSLLFGVNSNQVLAQMQTTGATNVSGSAAGITFTNTTSKVIRGQPGTNANANTHTLRLGNAGITMTAASLTTGSVVIYNAPSGNATSNASTFVIEVNNGQSFVNDSASPLQFGRPDGLTGTLLRPGADSVSGTHALTVSGTGAGLVDMYCVIQDQPADATRIRSLVVNRSDPAAGAVRLFANNTYTGPTSVTAGTLLVNGTNTGGGTTIVGSGGVLGGLGRVAGPITFDSGSKLKFNAAGPLTASGSVSFVDPSTFGIDDIVGVDSSVPEGVYTLISGTVSTSGLANLGAANAFDLGSGKSAFFQSGSLQMVVVPEPTVVALLTTAGIAGATALRLRTWRRVRRS